MGRLFPGSSTIKPNLIGRINRFFTPDAKVSAWDVIQELPQAAREIFIEEPIRLIGGALAGTQEMKRFTDDYGRLPVKNKFLQATIGIKPIEPLSRQPLVAGTESFLRKRGAPEELAKFTSSIVGAGLVISSIDPRITGSSAKSGKVISSFDNIVPLKKISTLIKSIQPDIASVFRARGGKRVLAAAIRQKSGFFAYKDIETSLIKNVTGQFTSPRDMALIQDDIPYRTSLEFGPIYRRIHEPTQKALAGAANWGNEQAVKVRNLLNANGVSINARQGRLLTKVTESIPNIKLKSLSAVELMESFPTKGANLKHYRVAKEVRELFDGWRNTTNAVREGLGKKSMGEIDSYVPHMQRTGFWNKLLGESESTISEAFDFIIPNEKTNRRALRRIGQMAENERETNFFKLMDSYIDSSSKDIFISPAIENIKVHNSVIKSRGFNKAASFWDEYIRIQLVGKKHKLDTIFQVERGGKSEAILQKIQEARYKGGLVGNLSWMVALQPTSFVALTPKEAGLINTLKGGTKWFFSKEVRRLAGESTALRLKTGQKGLITEKIISGAPRRVWSGNVDKVNDVLGAIANWEEKHLTGMSFAAGLDAGKKLGFEGEDNLRFANIVAERTQSMYNRGSKPMILNSDIFKTAAPFQTFFMEMNSHAREILGVGGIPQKTKQRIFMGMNLIVGMYMANLYSNQVRGRPAFTPGSFLPVIGEPLETAGKKALGLERSFTRGRQPIAPLEDVDQLARAMMPAARYVTSYGKDGDIQQLRKSLVFWGLGLSGVGGAAQVNRLVDGLIQSELGFAPTATGRARYPVELNLKTILIGTASTDVARVYYEEGLSALSEKQTAQVKNSSNPNLTFFQIHQDRVERKTEAVRKDFRRGVTTNDQAEAYLRAKEDGDRILEKLREALDLSTANYPRSTPRRTTPTTPKRRRVEGLNR